MARKKKTKKHEGKIFEINPKHVVDSKLWKAYKKAKGPKVGNNRPVMIGIEKSNRKVQISTLTTKATVKQLQKKQKVRLKKTYPSKNSFVDTNAIAKSKFTKKPFKIGVSPLVKYKKKIHADDLIEYKKARKSRRR